MSRNSDFFHPTKKELKRVTQIPSLVGVLHDLGTASRPPGFPQHTGKELLKLGEILKYLQGFSTIQPVVIALGFLNVVNSMP